MSRADNIRSSHVLGSFYRATVLLTPCWQQTAVESWPILGPRPLLPRRWLRSSADLPGFQLPHLRPNRSKCRDPVRISCQNSVSPHGLQRYLDKDRREGKTYGTRVDRFCSKGLRRRSRQTQTSQWRLLQENGAVSPPSVFDPASQASPGLGSIGMHFAHPAVSPRQARPCLLRENRQSNIRPGRIATDARVLGTKVRPPSPPPYSSPLPDGDPLTSTRRRSVQRRRTSRRSFASRGAEVGHPPRSGAPLQRSVQRRHDSRRSSTIRPGQSRFIDRKHLLHRTAGSAAARPPANAL